MKNKFLYFVIVFIYTGAACLLAGINNKAPVETERVQFRLEGNHKNNEHPKVCDHKYYKHKPTGDISPKMHRSNIEGQKYI